MPRDGQSGAIGRLLFFVTLAALCTHTASAQTSNAEKAPANAPSQAAATDAAPANATEANPSPAANAAAPVADPSATAMAPEAPVDPVIAAVRNKIAADATKANIHEDDAAAIAEFYGALNGPPLWVDKDGLTGKAKALEAEIRKGPDWGFKDDDFILPASPPASAPTDVLADAELQLTVAALRYARFARGGRLNPRNISRILDFDPPVKDPKMVLADLAGASTPDAYLRGLQPQHPQFELLRQAYLKARAPTAAEEPMDEALKIKLPLKGKTIKAGSEHDDIIRLRKRLKQPAGIGVNAAFLDNKLSDALKAYQKEHGLKVSGDLTRETRRALNKEGQKDKPQPEKTVNQILINMEKWRWLPEDLGTFYVWDNIPEFYARVIKNDNEVFKEKIIVGLPEWATPAFSSELKFIIFNPSWGVPNGIKQRELLPRLRRAGGGGFFDQLFGGGGGGGAAVLRAYGLNAYKNGRQVDPNSVNWSQVDIRSYSFTQPPGGKNPLGFVKFRFPNKHDVYMHDTTQRELFSKSYRGLSHGCMRVQNPQKLADVLLEHDRGWSSERSRQARSRSENITLNTPIPVHVTYMTVMADENGKLSRFGDIYGHDSKIARALGRPMTFEAPRPADSYETASTDSDPPPATNKKKNQNNKRDTKRERNSNDFIRNSLSGLVAN